ncbi:MAG TPA: site-specific integrase [Melioribacteraceae bacterium]|nr:site-specific integrase [Melioribacteraceae bacterium]
MLMYTGLRPSDIINITVEQIDLLKMEMRFYSSKTDNWFVRPIHEKLTDILTTRINEVKTGRIFNYSNSKAMERAVRRYYAALKMSDRGYTIRTFRKDFISRSQESGVSIAATAMLVGHSNIKTTMTYYTKFSSNHLKDELSKLK